MEARAILANTFREQDLEFFGGHLELATESEKIRPDLSGHQPSHRIKKIGMTCRWYHNDLRHLAVRP